MHVATRLLGAVLLFVLGTARPARAHGCPHHADPLALLVDIPPDTALRILALVPDATLHPPAAERPYLTAVLPDAVQRFMREPYDTVRLRRGLEAGAARYAAALRKASDELVSRQPTAPGELDRRRAAWSDAGNRLRWFRALLADVDAPAAPAGSPATTADHAALATDMRRLIETNRELDRMLERTPVAGSAPLEELRSLLLIPSVDGLADALESPAAWLTPQGRRAVAPLVALVRLYRLDADIELRVSTLRGGARAQLERRGGRSAGAQP